MNSPFRWGVLGCGGIAKQFSAGVAVLPHSEIRAVASQSQQRATNLAQEFGVPHAHGTYDELCARDDIDAIYVATTHNFHYQDVKRCLLAGKPVLCEKPFTVFGHQTHELIQLAREKGLFLMEGMWTRFLPAMQQFRKKVSENAIGEIYTVQAAFHVRGNTDPKGRWMNPDLAGGAMLDIGVYPISLANWIFEGAPSRIQGHGVLSEEGVDIESYYDLEYPGRRFAKLSSSFRSYSSNEAIIYGSQGHIRIPRFFCPEKFTIFRPGKGMEHIDGHYESSGFQFEIAEVQACIQAGKLESDIMPLDESRAIMQTMDTLREQMGLMYPETLNR